MATQMSLYRKASDAERDHYGDRLSAAFAVGQLTQTEYDDRIDALLLARSVAELRALVVDLDDDPIGDPDPAPVAAAAVLAEITTASIKRGASFAVLTAVAALLVTFVAFGFEPDVSGLVWAAMLWGFGLVCAGTTAVLVSRGR